MTPAERLHQRWIEECYHAWHGPREMQDCPLADLGLPMANEELVAAKEKLLALTFPEEFREHILRGFLSSDHDDAENMITFWALDRLATVRSELGNDHYNSANDPLDEYVVFADLMGWCWAWALNCGDGPDRGRIALLKDRDHWHVFNSFSEFADCYLEAAIDLACEGYRTSERQAVTVGAPHK